MTTKYEAVVIRGQALLEEFLRKAQQMSMFDMLGKPEPAPKAKAPPAAPRAAAPTEPVTVREGTPRKPGYKIPPPPAAAPAAPAHGSPEYHRDKAAYHAGKRDAHQVGSGAEHEQAAGMHEAARALHDMAGKGITPSSAADHISGLADQASTTAGDPAAPSSGGDGGTFAAREKIWQEHDQQRNVHLAKQRHHLSLSGTGEVKDLNPSEAAHRAATKAHHVAASAHLHARDGALPVDGTTTPAQDRAGEASKTAEAMSEAALEAEHLQDAAQAEREKYAPEHRRLAAHLREKASDHSHRGEQASSATVQQAHRDAASANTAAARLHVRALESGSKADRAAAYAASDNATRLTSEASQLEASRESEQVQAAPKKKAGACGVPPGGGWTRTRKGWKKGQGRTYRWLPQDWCREDKKHGKHWGSMTGREKMAAAQKDAAARGARVGFTGVSHQVTDEGGNVTTHETLDHARQHVAESIATTGGASGKQARGKPEGGGAGSGVRGDGAEGPGTAGRTDEGAGEGPGGTPGGAQGKEPIQEQVKHATEAVVGPFSDPSGEKVEPVSPALYPGEDPEGFAATLPPIPDDLRLPESIINFPHPAPLHDSDGNLTGYIKRLYDHQIEGAERVLAAWDRGDGAVLQDDAGLGKTNTALAAMVANGGRRNLIVVPTNGKEGLKRQWMGDKCAGLYGIEVRGVDNLSATEDGTYCVSYDELLEQELNADGTGKTVTVGKGANAKQQKVMKIKDEFQDGTWDTIFFDESHNMKGEGQRAMAAITLQGKAEKVCYMSATPYQNVSDMHYLVRLGLFGDGPEEFAQWAEKAGASVDGNVVKDPSSPLPMAAVSATLHVDGLSLKRITSLEGCSNEFNQQTMEGVPEDKRKAFDLADELLAEVGGSIDDGILKALYVGWAKQYWEVLKVPEAIEMGKKYQSEGKQVAFFTSYKNADHAHLRAIPRMLRRRAERLADQGKDMAAMMLDDKARNCEEILSQMPAAGSAVEMLTNAFGGPRVVAEIHGNTGKKPADEQDRYQNGSKKVVVATMARGGTGISLHDTTGENPRVQINLSLPWSGREYSQVAGRSHRLGSKSGTIMHWLMGDHESERHNAAKVAHRLKSMGALCAGDPELTQDSTGLANWGAGMSSVTSSDDVEDSIKALEECIEEAEDGGDGGKLSQEAQESRDYFMEFARARAEGRDVLGERHSARMEKKRRMEFREARRAAQQIRQFTARGPQYGGHPHAIGGLEITWRPGLGEHGVWEVHKGSQPAKVFGGVKSKGIGGEHKPYLDSYWVTSDKLPLLAQKMKAHKEKVDLAKLSRPENFDPAKRTAAHVLRDRFAELGLKLIPVTAMGWPASSRAVDVTTGKEHEGNRSDLPEGGIYGTESLTEHAVDEPDPRWGIVSIKPRGKEASAYKYRGSPLRSAGATYESYSQVWHFPAGKAEEVLENIQKVNDGTYEYPNTGYGSGYSGARRSSGYRSRWRRSLVGGRMGIRNGSMSRTYQGAVDRGWGLMQDFMPGGNAAEEEENEMKKGGGAGWQNIPGGKVAGGKRRRKGSSWEYRYPKTGIQATPHLAEPASVHETHWENEDNPMARSPSSGKKSIRSTPMRTTRPTTYSDMLKGAGCLPFALSDDPREGDLAKSMVTPGMSGIEVPENVVDGIVEITPPGTGGFDSEDPPDRIQDIYDEPGDAITVTPNVPGGPGTMGSLY